MQNDRKPNRLSAEKSPYLLQHAFNPVDWRPWSDEAFQEARDRDVPLFLSIGYSTCHWCHVMAHESFEDGEVAEILNREFVCVKVDREEMPDVDHIYMAAAQLMTGSGGWPLTLVLSPARKPIFAATYLPKHSRHGMPGLMEMLPAIIKAWKERREELQEGSEQVIKAVLQTQTSLAAPSADLEGAAEGALYLFSASFDEENGGFGQAPKFPIPSELLFLLRTADESGNARRMAEQTLLSMRRGGIYDQAGGGFHRYSTDARWHAPHFEKMLYDNALLSEAFLEASRLTGRPVFARTVRETLDFVIRELRLPESGFASALDADGPGGEGEYYTWAWDELRAVLSPALLEDARGAFGVSEEGNWEEGGKSTGRNILHRPASDGIPETDPPSVAEILRLLNAERAKREKPFRDGKVLADWNGLAIAALARAGTALNAPEYVKAARAAALFVLDALSPDPGILMHSWAAGTTSGAAFLSDYAWMGNALLSLYEADFDSAWLTHAFAFARAIPSLFADPDGGAWFEAAESANGLPARPRMSRDGALPSGHSGAYLLFSRLYHLSGAAEWLQYADRTLQTAGDLAGEPHSYAFLLAAAGWSTGKAVTAVISGPASDPVYVEMLETLRRELPAESMILKRGESGGDALPAFAPWTAALRSEGKATAWICRDGACGLPAYDASAVSARIRGK